MCDDVTERENVEAGLTRRALAVVMGSAGVASALPGCAFAASVVEEEVQIRTPDGVIDAVLARPAKGKHAAVIVWPDIFGIRPAFREMGKRLAGEGYAVLTVNPFYRDGAGPVKLEGDNPRSPENFAKLRGFAAKLDHANVVEDATALVAFLDKHPSVNKRRKIGTTGYCMGGPLVVRTATAVPTRIGAVASFHGGGLVTDKPDSPHQLLKSTKAVFLIAVAQNDDERAPQDKDVLKAAFAAAKLKAEIEVYPAMHGWCPPDSAAYDKVQAERAWARLLALFKARLRA
jgi:carboxymethylenebutenolidase